MSETELERFICDIPARRSQIVKRGFDFFVALLAGMLLLFLIVMTALIVKLTSVGPALYWTDRIGRNNKIFKMPKFRSMRVDTPAVATHLLVDPAAYLTPIGSFLRKSSLDELPQLWNVVRGEMSLVGPRPIVALEATHYGDNLTELLSVRPGLTGLWAVEGRSQLGYPLRAEVELRYVRTRSLGTDMAILARTPWTVITQRGTV